MVRIPQVFAEQFADRRAAGRVAPLGQARVEIELGGDAVKRHEKGEDIDHQLEVLVRAKLSHLARVKPTPQNCWRGTVEKL